MGKKVGWFLAFLALVMFSAGCTPGKSTVTEEDRVVLDHSVQIARLEKAKIGFIVGLIGGDRAVLVASIHELEALNLDAIANAEQLQKNWGQPQQATSYSPEAAAKARQDSDKSHLPKGFWGWLAGAFSIGGSIALGIARSPLARMIPGFGPVFSALDTTITAVESFMQKKKSTGQVDVVAELRDTLQKAHEDAKLRPYIDKFLAKAQDKLGVDVAPILAPTPAAAVPAPTVSQS